MTIPIRPPAVPARADPEPPDLFTVERLTPAAVAVHAAGGLLNAAGIVLAAGFLARHLAGLAAGWWLAVLAALAATFAADFVSGVLHWGFDTWFSENTVVRRMVVRVREHHVHPNRIFRYGFAEDAGLLAWFAVACSVLPLAGAWLLDSLPMPVRCALAVAALTMAVELELMAELHKCGHRVQRGPLVRLLQRVHLLLSPEHHLRHHSGAHDSHYCLITGWADDTLGRLGAFRGLERLAVAVLPRLAPRQNDLDWQRRARQEAPR
jgi:ubiquitin-conjugating enzyme E2 variant